MIEQDTIRLLKECDKGIEMGVSSIDEVISYIKEKELKSILNQSKKEHLRIKKELNKLLDEYKDEGKDFNNIIKWMSNLKTKMKLMINKEDSHVAELMIDGSNMGIKSLTKYLNRYVAADERSKDIAKQIINEEKELIYKLEKYIK